ncbi:hypothetical protein Dimus_005841 [Dionaea muscipula]
MAQQQQQQQQQQQVQYPMNQIHTQTYEQSYPPSLQPQYPPLALQPHQPLTLPFPPQHHPHNPYQYHHQQQQQQSIPPQHPQQPFIPQFSLHPHHSSYPQPHIQAQPQLHHNRPSKRPREPPSEYPASGFEAGEDDPSAKRKKGHEVLFRIVVPSRQIGKVIGKQGSRIQKIREDSKANIKIADAIARYEERVIIISSKNNEDGITDAEKALHQIADLILKEDGNPLEALSVAGAGAMGATSSSIVSVGGIDMAGSLGIIDGITGAHLVANAVRLLIAGSQAGGLIGVSGQNIEKIRNSSGASITVLAPNQLPYCASANESDRLVQISGEVSAVLKAVDEIGCQLRENPAKQVISISPAYNLTTTRAVPHYVDPTAAEYVTLDMVISETMVGGLIGRCGSNISRIRNESGAVIKAIAAADDGRFPQVGLSFTRRQDKFSDPVFLFHMLM